MKTECVEDTYPESGRYNGEGHMNMADWQCVKFCLFNFVEWGRYNGEGRMNMAAC